MAWVRMKVGAMEVGGRIAQLRAHIRDVKENVWKDHAVEGEYEIFSSLTNDKPSAGLKERIFYSYFVLIFFSSSTYILSLSLTLSLCPSRSDLENGSNCYAC